MPIATNTSGWIARVALAAYAGCCAAFDAAMRGLRGGGSKKPNLKAEFSREPHRRGVVSTARTSDPNSANSQFFIVFKDSNFLDGQYTVWGKVTSGMEFVDKIKKGAPGSGAVSAPADKMIKVQVAADAKS